jgi:hypothetical protein
VPVRNHLPDDELIKGASSAAQRGLVESKDARGPNFFGETMRLRSRPEEAERLDIAIGETEQAIGSCFDARRAAELRLKLEHLRRKRRSVRRPIEAPRV